MTDPSSANTWPWHARPRAASRRPARYSVSREGIRLVGSFRRPERVFARTRPEWTRVWTLYSRFEWALATARVERVRRRARPLWR
jgi:hypothetical protein